MRIMGAAQSAIRAVPGILRNGPLMLSMGIPLALGNVVGLASLPAVFNWYIPKLDKPKWAPPAPVFGQTWAVLYAVMGAASYLVGKDIGWTARPMQVYAAQLLLNLAWQPLFFLIKAPAVAQADNLALLGAAAYTTHEFWKVNPTAGKMMLPYVAFLVYANALNYSVWKRNPEEFPDQDKVRPKVS
jgi:tryptophan-rich sensory protein